MNFDSGFNSQVFIPPLLHSIESGEERPSGNKSHRTVSVCRIPSVVNRVTRLYNFFTKKRPSSEKLWVWVGNEKRKRKKTCSAGWDEKKLEIFEYFRLGGLRACGNEKLGFRYAYGNRIF